jgi:exosome complex RNA-binding protein Rrp4
VSGEREQEEIEGLPQVDENGNPLPAAQRTHFGLAFGDNGTVWVDGATEGLSYVNVVLLNEQTIASPQRVWQ